MSRSRRRHLFIPHAGHSSESMKWYKQYHNGRNRAKLRTMLANGNYDVGYELIPWDEWDCPRDGYRLMEDPVYGRK